MLEVDPNRSAFTSMERLMRLFVAASALCIGLLPLAFAAPPAAAPSAASVGPPASRAAAAPAEVPDAAAKHAKRTACLKTAKTRKLIGADKTAFIKNCLATP
jgi:hypothetical protein